MDTANPLVKLAIYIYNFIPNSASCERLFSDMGNIKAKKCNRLSTRKTRDCAFIKGELRSQHAKQGTARQRLKRQFGIKGGAPLDADPTVSQLEEEEFLKEIDNVTESEDSDESNESDTLPESILEPDPSRSSSNPSCVIQVAQQLMRAVEDDSDESDVDEDLVPSLSESLVTLKAGTSKVSGFTC